MLVILPAEISNETKCLEWRSVIAYMFNLQIIIPVIRLGNARNYFESR